MIRCGVLMTFPWIWASCKEDEEASFPETSEEKNLINNRTCYISSKRKKLYIR
jgi:hypothetical protein